MGRPRDMARYYFKPRSIVFWPGVVKLTAGIVLGVAWLTDSPGVATILGELVGGSPLDLIMAGLIIIGGRAALGGKVPSWL